MMQRYDEPLGHAVVYTYRSEYKRIITARVLWLLTIINCLIFEIKMVKTALICC